MSQFNDLAGWLPPLLHDAAGVTAVVACFGQGGVFCLSFFLPSFAIVARLFFVAFRYVSLRFASFRLQCTVPSRRVSYAASDLYYIVSYRIASRRVVSNHNVS